MDLRFRIGTFLASFVLTFLLGRVAIPILQRLKFGKEVRNDGPEKHLSKQGTPTMGGVIFILGTLIPAWGAAFFLKLSTGAAGLFFATASMLGFGLIGFADDLIQAVKKRSLGLRAWQKILAQILVSLGIAIWAMALGGANGTSLLLPWAGTYWRLGYLFVPFAMVFCIAVVNCVNLTDGLDGLSASLTMINTLAYGILFPLLMGATLRGGSYDISAMMDLQPFISAFAGSLLAYLVYNVYPARLFMGDTGSFAMGGALCAIALVSKTALWIPIMGICYVASGASVILQVGSFKLRGGKRIFKMAPIHHHFELLGYQETKVVEGYRIVTILACALMITAV